MVHLDNRWRLNHILDPLLGGGGCWENAPAPGNGENGTLGQRPRLFAAAFRSIASSGRTRQAAELHLGVRSVLAALPRGGARTAGIEIAFQTAESRR